MPPIICYKYNKPISNIIHVFNFNKLVSDLDIDANTPNSGHNFTVNLKIIPDSRIRYIVSKRPKYTFPSHIDFNKCRE